MASPLQSQALSAILSGVPMPGPGASSVVAQNISQAAMMGDQVRQQRALQEAVKANTSDEGLDFDAVSKAALRAGDLNTFLNLQQLKAAGTKATAEARQKAMESLPVMARLAAQFPEVTGNVQRLLGEAGIAIDGLDRNGLMRLSDALADPEKRWQILSGEAAESLNFRPGAVVARSGAGDFKILQDSDVRSDAAQAQALQRAVAGSPRVDARTFVSSTEESAFDKKLGEGRGERVNAEINAFEDARNLARSTLKSVQRAERLLDRADTGAGSQTRTAAKALAKDVLGVDLAALGVDDNVAPTQAFGAVMSELALDRMSKLKGPASDRDVEFIKSAGPGVWATKEANRILLQASKRAAQIDIQAADKVQRILEAKRKAGQVPELDAADRRELDLLYAQDFFTDRERERLDALSKKRPGGMELAPQQPRGQASQGGATAWDDLVKRR